MKISSLHHKIKDTGTLFLASFAVGVALLSGCAATVAEATFPVRPDTTEPGDLLGPFDGRVVDAATGRPLGGATVFASWGFESGRGLTQPAGATSRVVETDTDGRYLVPKLANWPARARVSRFTMVIYKREYLGYRSDRRFDDLGPRRDFSQTGNLVKLDRFPAGLSHARHVRFVGGGGALRAALAGEEMLAALELSGQAPPPSETGQPAGPPLDVGALLSEEELRAATGYEGPFLHERLADLPRTSGYDSKHFRAVDKPESFDAAYRVWKLPAAQAEARFKAVEKEMPSPEPLAELGDAGVRGHDGKILGAAVLDRERGLVVKLTCGVDLCRDAEQVAGLLRRVLSRAQRLGAVEEPASDEEEPAREEKPAEDNPFKLKQPELRR